MTPAEHLRRAQVTAEARATGVVPLDERFAPPLIEGRHPCPRCGYMVQRFERRTRWGQLIQCTSCEVRWLVGR